MTMVLWALVSGGLTIAAGGAWLLERRSRRIGAHHDAPRRKRPRLAG